ncbi:deoxyribonuclease IV [Aerococcaceae bacterium DSM 111020]|nr:deoxyribonuclease IV [Aerococcaceae bacterium DSM 111020]
MLIGSHVSLSGKEMLFGSAKEATSYGSSVFMVYTGAPQNTRRKDIELFRRDEAFAWMEEHDLAFFTVHAPYIINLANTTKEGYHEFAIEFLQQEIQRVEYLGADQITFHPGSHVGAGTDIGIKQIVHGLNLVLRPDQTAQISLETMAGKGTEIGRTFEELAQIIDGVTHNEKLSITLDTCHIHDAGYDVVHDLDGTLTAFDKIIGLDRLKVIHINDSKNGCGSHKDRHANIGQGEIGFDALNRIVHLPEFSDLPKLLETPWVPIEEGSKVKLPPYQFEIAMFKNQTLNPHLMQDILSQEV